MDSFKDYNNQDILGSLRTGGMDTTPNKAVLAPW